MSTPRLVLATHNAGKVAELRQILGTIVAGFEAGLVVGAGDLGLDPAVEDGVTFEDNALLKARDVAARSGLPTVADDSGLCVDVLGGAPGVFSARWSGRHGDDASNNALLLAQLADVPAEHRGARFVCAAALVRADGSAVGEVAEMRGRLLDEPRGSGGFGYDPLFVPEGLERTSAELGPAEKNAISHRGKAFAALAPELARVLQ